MKYIVNKDLPILILKEDREEAEIIKIHSVIGKEREEDKIYSGNVELTTGEKRNITFKFATDDVSKHIIRLEESEYVWGIYFEEFFRGKTKEDIQSLLEITESFPDEEFLELYVSKRRYDTIIPRKIIISESKKRLNK